MSLDRAAGALLIGLPVAFNLFFFLLGRLFDYPTILRSPVGDVLRRFHAGGLRLKLVWVRLHVHRRPARPARRPARPDPRPRPARNRPSGNDDRDPRRHRAVPRARTLALPRAHARANLREPRRDPATREATAVVFDSFNRYLGIAIGECFGYLFTGAWTVLASVAMLQSSAFDAWLAWPGLAVGLFLILGSLEFVGPFEERGWPVAGAIVPVAYVAWSLWLIAAGVVLVV